MKSGLKEQITQLYSQGLSYSEINKQLNCSKSTISYYVSHLAKIKLAKLKDSKPLNKTIKTAKEKKVKYTLSPYGQVVKTESCKLLDLSSTLGVDSKICKYCGKVISHRGNVCNTCISRIRRYNFKNQAVVYLGGKCSKCGYNAHLAALEFHHTDNNKEFSIGAKLNKKWESIVKELDKCILLCSNCHRIEHSKYEDFIINI